MFLKMQKMKNEKKKDLVKEAHIIIYKKYIMLFPRIQNFHQIYKFYQKSISKASNNEYIGFGREQKDNPNEK